jgi:hypothetical protein
VKIKISINCLGFCSLLIIVLCGFGVGYLTHYPSSNARSLADPKSTCVVKISTNNEWVTELNITAHALRNYGPLSFITNTLHKAVLVTVIGKKEMGTCQALLCLSQENQIKHVMVIGLNPFKFIDFLADGAYPISEEIYKALEEPEKLFGDGEDHKIRNAIFPLIFKRNGQQWTDEWKKGMYFYKPIQQMTWLRFKCINSDKALSKKGFMPTEVSYFIGDDGTVIAHKVTGGIFSD